MLHKTICNALSENSAKNASFLTFMLRPICSLNKDDSSIGAVEIMKTIKIEIKNLKIENQRFHI